MARRKGVAKSRNSGTRKQITDSSQPLKANSRLKDDPGGTAAPKQKTSNRTMDGSKLISTENQARNALHTNMIDHHNRQHQQKYGNSRVSPSFDVSNPTTKKATGSIESERVSKPTEVSVASTICKDSSESKTATSASKPIKFSTESTIIHKNNNSSHKNNSSKSNSMTTTTTLTSSTSSSSLNDLKYLHKKFKRIASATSEGGSSTNAIEYSNSIENRSKPENFNTNHDSNNSNSSSSCNISLAAPIKVEQNIEITDEKSAQVKVSSNPYRFKEEPVDEPTGGNYILVNGTGRLTPLFQIVEIASLADTGYGSDGEMKANTCTSNGLYKSNDSVASSNHQVVNNNVVNRLSAAKLSLNSPNKATPTTILTARSSSNFEVAQNSPKSLVPPSQTPRQLNIIPSAHSPLRQHSPQPNQNQQSQQQQLLLQQQQQQQQQIVDQNSSVRHPCPFCQLNCTKPSVLQKHIRTHTNERPYHCVTCSFAFKTKSNYYKHCRSRTHALRVKGIEPQPEDENSIGSDPDPDPDVSNSSSDVVSGTNSPYDERTSSPAMQQHCLNNAASVVSNHQYTKHLLDKPYKPKFHNAAAFYAKDDHSSQQQKEQILHIQQQQHQQQQQQQQQQTQLFQHSQQLQQHIQLQQAQEQQLHHIQHNSQRSSQHLPQTGPPTRVKYLADVGALSPHYQQLAHHHKHQQLSMKGRGELMVRSSSVQQDGVSSTYSESSSRDVTAAPAVPMLARSLSAGGIVGHQLNVEEHISNLILRNEAIVNKELPLPKKYPKVSAKSKPIPTVMSNTTSRLAYTLSSKQQQQQQQQQQNQQQSYQQHQQLQSQSSTLLAISSTGAPPVASIHPSQKSTIQQALSLQQQHHQQTQLGAKQLHQPQIQLTEPGSSQPLNLSKVGEQIDLTRKRTPNETFSAPVTNENASTSSGKSMTHPQNPERSIIKNLLLNARGQAIPNGEGCQPTYTCVLCKMEFHSSEDLRCHAINYCQGGPSSAPISPVGSPAFKYSRSNSISVNLPELNNPNSLAKLARSKLLLSQNPSTLAKLAWSQLKTKPSNLVLTQLSVNTNSTPTTSSCQMPTSTSCSSTSQKLTDTPLPSPGPLLGKTPLVESYNNSDRKTDDVIITKMHEETRQFIKSFSPKRLRFDGYPAVNSSPNSSTGSVETSGLASVGRGFSMCGGEMTPIDKKEEPMKRFFSSGGCMIPLSECPDMENSPKIIRTPLLSGGSFTEISPKPPVPQTPKNAIPMQPVAGSLTSGMPMTGILNAASLTRFQFPPINSITAFNPLTLPPVSMGTILPSSVSHGDKMIPFVPGIPGPNTLLAPHLTLQPPKVINRADVSRNISPNRKNAPSPLVQGSGTVQSGLPYPSPQKQVLLRGDEDPDRGSDFFTRQRSPRSWISPADPPPKKSFNFTRIADNLSPRKQSNERSAKSPERTVEVTRHFNFDQIEQGKNESDPNSSTGSRMAPLHVDVSSSSTKEKELPPSSTAISCTTESKIGIKSKFLRPTSLPLKPGTFTPKCHHGITPTANTLPLISPETPRPSKACVQLYLNGHAYTYLGLKSSTKMFYCTVNCPQPSYIANMHRLSMYSVWQVCAENNPHPLGVKPKAVMSLYDSRQRGHSYVASMKSTMKTVHSQRVIMTPFENNNGQFYHHQIKALTKKQAKSIMKQNTHTTSSDSQNLVGGYKSNDNYTYVRGRGRGRYVCAECGIRCRKPSMLKKHIRTHSDVRPYTCKHCSFSFKTKGNLTKHMQSKTHYKKCLEVGVNPGPMPEGGFTESEFEVSQQFMGFGSGRTSTGPGESDSDETSDGNEGETESSDADDSKSRLAEHEAARSLLSLSMTPPSNNSNVSPNPFSQQQNSQYSSYHEQGEAQSFGEHVFESISERRSSDEPPANRRVISFTSPKPPFDYQKQEQYFSNPSLNLKPIKVEDAAMKPIDLTKPRKVESSTLSRTSATPPSSSHYPRISDVVCELSSESGLIKSLVSITNKIRPNMEHCFVQEANKFNDDAQLQTYLTEQALQYTKIKQSQMNKNFNMPVLTTTTSSVVITSIPTITITDATKMTTTMADSTTSTEVTTSVVTVSTAIVSAATVSLPADSPTIPKIPVKSESPSESDFSEAPTTLPTSNTVLDHRIENGEESQSEENALDASDSATSKLQAVPPATNAKSVATEYLKMTSAESRTTRVEESDDSSSDQELSAAEMGLKSSGDFTGIVPPTVIVGEDGFRSSNEVQPMFRVHLSDDGRPICKICSKTFQKQHQMVLHMNIHYMERKFKCEPCAVSFRTQGHLQKHERSEAHKNKVMMNSTFGVPTTSNPRPFECSDCKVAFRIHGHLAKHLRSKTHVQKLECLQKLPFGTYAEIERAGISLTEIDTTDCDNSLASLRELAQRLIEKDPTKMGAYTKPSCIDGGTNSQESGSEDSPDGMPNDTLDTVSELAGLPQSASGMPASESGSTFADSPAGVKRKFDSFSSCSNDSITNVANQSSIVVSEGASEKRVRTNSDP